MTFPCQVKIVEVGPRDGLQNESQALTLSDKLAFIQLLIAAGLPVIEAGSFVAPERVPQLANTEELLTLLAEEPAWQDQSVSFPALVLNPRGLERALSCGAREIAIVGAASNSFLKKNMNCNVSESLARFEPIVKQAIQAGLRVRGYLSCTLGCPYEGDVAYQATAELASRFYEWGCYEISLGDTIGVGTPNKVLALLDKVLTQLPTTAVAVHFHDTYGQALANIYAALSYEVATIDAAVAGLGGCPYARGASGNVATEDVLYLLDGLGIASGVDAGALLKASNAICQLLGKSPNSKVALASQ